MRHGALPVVALTTIAMALLYAHVFAGEVTGDDLTFHMAESARLADCLRDGDYDLWNPSGNAGFASAYYYQVVPQLLSAAPAAVFGHHLLFFQLTVFLPLVLAPAAAYRGMRLLGATPWQAAIAGLAIGLLNGESRWGAGNASTFGVGLYTQTMALAAFPIALGHAARWATDARSLAPAIAWGTFVTACHPFAGISLAIALIAGVIAQLALRVIDRALARLGHNLGRAPILENGERVDDRIGTGVASDTPAGDDIATAAKRTLGERWRNPPPRPWLGELGRLVFLGICFGVTWMPIWLPLIVDYAGFGGFPHRVADEVGPGFATLGKWYANGGLLDFRRPMVMTWTLPFIIVFARAPYLRWLWSPAIVYATWLGLGPHIGKTDDDLIPAVRFLGALQIVLALAIAAGAIRIAALLWNAPEGSVLHRPIRAVLSLIVPRRHRSWAIDVPLQFSVRTGIAALASALFVLLGFAVFPLSARVRVLDDYPGSRPAELRTLTTLLRWQPPGRKQVGAGAESHYWNLLTYVYGRRPSLLMMGGGGLQASPNYDFLWSVKDFIKNAWVFDAPLLVFAKSNEQKMPSGEDILATQGYLVRRLPSPGLVSPVEVTAVLPEGRKPARAAAIEWLKSSAPLEDRVRAYAGSGEPGAPPDATVVYAFRQDSPGDMADIYAEVEVTSPTTFVARESWHPRWRVYIDGVAAPIRRVTPDFPAVDVSPGRHILAWRFERPWWANAAWLTWLLVPLLAWFATRRTPRRRTAE